MRSTPKSLRSLLRCSLLRRSLLRCSLLALSLLALSACNQAPTGSGENKSASASGEVADDSEAYFRDVDRFCYAEKHAGVLDVETTDRSVIAADWLGRNLETQRARSFLAGISTLPATDKAAKLRAEGEKAKLAGCPTADAWDAEASATQ